jgi:hypothetical protein
MPFTFAAALPVLGNALGGLFENRSQAGNIAAVADLAERAGTVNPFGFQGSGGALSFQDGQGIFQMSPQQQAIMGQISGLTSGALTGQGLQSQFFNQANLGQDPAFAQQQAALAQGFDPSQFDVRDIIDQRLAALNKAAAPGEAQARQDFLSAAQGSGRGATTGGMKLAEQFGAGQQRAADERILAAQQFGLQTQGQLFGQGLQAHQQNLTAGQQRLSNMLNLFGLGSGAIAQDLSGAQGFFGLGQNQQQMENQLFLGSLGADAARQQAQASVLGGMTDLLPEQGSHAAQTGGMISGALGALGGMFSDARLKQDIELYKTVGDINFYKFNWKPHAMGVQPNMVGSDMGVIAQELAETHPDLVAIDQRTGYYMVDYSGLREVIENG